MAEVIQEKYAQDRDPHWGENTEDRKTISGLSASFLSNSNMSDVAASLADKNAVSFKFV